MPQNSLVELLNDQAGTSGLTEVAAARVWAAEVTGRTDLTQVEQVVAINLACGTTGLTQVEALNKWNGTVGQSAIEVLDTETGGVVTPAGGSVLLLASGDELLMSSGDAILLAQG